MNRFEIALRWTVGAASAEEARVTADILA